MFGLRKNDAGAKEADWGAAEIEGAMAKQEMINALQKPQGKVRNNNAGSAPQSSSTNVGDLHCGDKSHLAK